MTKHCVFILCAFAFLGVGADDLSDFSNDLASDIGPLLALFGESMTKQYLSESTSFLDYFIFAMAPIGIITAIVSTIRVCGKSSLRAFIGRSQEGEGVVEAELCTSTSRDVCELFNKGGITRVLGRPSILELIYFPRDKSLRLARYYFENNAEDPDQSWWEREKASWFETDNAPSVAPNPNLSLNVGIVKKPDWVFYAIAILGFILQAGVLALAGVGVWILHWNLGEVGSSASRDYAPIMYIAGTVLMCGGMWSCAALIGQTTREVRFRRTTSRMHGPDGRPDAKQADHPHLLWLQPGPQVIGDQSFDPFAYFDDADVTKGLQVWSSSRKDFKEKFETYTFFAVLAVLVGYIMQFIGLRGMRSWVSLTQLGITIVMSVLRGCLRMKRIDRSDNRLLTMPDLVSGHELDWLSFEIARGGRQGPTPRAEGDMEVKEAKLKEGTVTVWHVASGFDQHNSQPCRPSSGSQDKTGKASKRKVDYAHLLSVRKQLAHQTGNTAFGGETEYQHWKHSQVKVRAKAIELSGAICHAAENLTKRGQWKNMQQFQNIEKVQDITLQIQTVACESPGAEQTISHEQLVSIVLKPPNDANPHWSVDSAQLEAILGLWMWNLIYDERVLRSDDSSDQMASFAKAVRCSRIVSASTAENWNREGNRQGEMDLWLGKNTVSLSDDHVTLGSQTCHSMADLWTASSTDTTPKRLAPMYSKCGASQHEMRRFCGWSSISSLLGPASPGTTRKFDQQASRPVHRVQHVPTSGSLLEICAQELFVSLMKSLTGVLAAEETVVVEDAGSIRLENPRLATFARAFAECRLGSYSDALLCLVPAFRHQSGLPRPEDMLSVLLQAADIYRKASEWDRAQTALQWGCEMYAQEEDSASSIINPAFFARALRATGELYRWSLSQHSSKERKVFGLQGIDWMNKRFCTTGQNHPEVAQILHCYRRIADMFTQSPAFKVSATNLVRYHDDLMIAMYDKERAEVLYYLCFVGPGDLGPSGIVQRALFQAISNDWAEVVSATLEMKADPNILDGMGRTALGQCAEAGHESCMQPLIDAGASLESGDSDGRTPLMLAASSGHEKAVQLLLDGGRVSIEASNSRGETALVFAVHERHEGIVEALLEKGANINPTDYSGLTLLCFTARNGDMTILQALLGKGADVNAENGVMGPLHWAAAGGHGAIVQELLGKGANVDATSWQGWTPLHFAATAGDEATLQALLEKGADVNASDPRRQTAALLAAEAGHEDVLRVLLEKGANIHATDSDGSTVLHLAAREGHKEVVWELLKKEADINATDSGGLTPLHLAAREGHKAIVRALLEKGSDANATGLDGATPLHLAARERHTTIRLLLEKGADVNVTDSDGSTPLHLAAGQGYGAAVRKLLEKGADINAGRHSDGSTPLHLAAVEGREHTTRLLLKKGADMSATDSDGSTPLHLAIRTGYMTVRPLLEKGADIHATDSYGSTPLHLAAREGHQTVHPLLALGADVNARDSSGSTPLHLAAREGYGDVVWELLEKGSDIHARDLAGLTAEETAVEEREKALRREEWDGDASRSDAASLTTEYWDNLVRDYNRVLRTLAENKQSVDAVDGKDKKSGDEDGKDENSGDEDGKDGISDDEDKYSRDGKSEDEIDDGKDEDGEDEGEGEGEGEGEDEHGKDSGGGSYGRASSGRDNDGKDRE